MATYAIGDVQGCFKELMALVQVINFNPQHDVLWFTGDLVNRGPQSLEVLRYVKALQDKAIVVLGNHDLHLLAVASGAVPARAQDTFVDVLQASDRDALCHWLSQQHLIYHDAKLDFVLVHAGIPPQWQLIQAQQYAQEVQQMLISNSAHKFFQQMYGNTPQIWDDNLSGMDRLRLITNYLTRMRFCDVNGKLDLTMKGAKAEQQGYIPWFEIPHRLTKNLNIIFGHWAALNGKVNEPHLYALDTGCVWGNCLTAMRVEDQQLFKVPCAQKPSAN